MFKRQILNRSIILGLALAAMGVSAFAEDLDGNVDTFRVQESSAIEGVVQGKVSFIRRTTIVPMAQIYVICDLGRPCVEPQVYWSMVVQSLNGSYELDETFAMGSSREPQEVQFFGRTIRAGSQVAVEGKIQPVSLDYAIISNVRKITLIDELMFKVGRQDYLRIFNSKWECKSAETQNGTSTHVQVWSGIQAVEPSYLPQEVFQITLSEKQAKSSKPQTVAEINRVQIQVQADAVIYNGTAENLEVALKIQDNESFFHEIPGELRIARQAPEGRIEAILPVKCNRKNFF